MELVSVSESGELSVGAPEPPTNHAIPIYLNAQTQFPQDTSSSALLAPHLRPALASLAELPRARKEKEYIEALSSLPANELDILLEYSPTLRQLVEGSERGRAMRLAQHAGDQRKLWMDNHLATTFFPTKTAATIDSSLVEIYGNRFGSAMLVRPRDGWAFYALIPVRTGEDSEVTYNVNFICLDGASAIAQKLESGVGKRSADWQQFADDTTLVPVAPYEFYEREIYPPQLDHKAIQLPRTDMNTSYYLVLTKGLASDHKTNYPLEWRLVIHQQQQSRQQAAADISKKSYPIFYKSSTGGGGGGSDSRTSGIVNGSFVPYFDVVDPRMHYDVSAEELRPKNVVTLAYQDDDTSEFTLNGQAYIPYVITAATKISDTLMIVSLSYCGERRRFLQRRRGIGDEFEYNKKTIGGLGGGSSDKAPRIIPDFFFRSFQILWPITTTITTSTNSDLVVPMTPLTGATPIKTDASYVGASEQDRATIDNAFLNNCRAWYLSYYLEAFDCETQGKYRC